MLRISIYPSCCDICSLSSVHVEKMDCSIVRVHNPRISFSFIDFGTIMKTCDDSKVRTERESTEPRMNALV